MEWTIGVIWASLGAAGLVSACARYGCYRHDAFLSPLAITAGPFAYPIIAWFFNHRLTEG
jgi:hypothetical protein